MNSGLTDIQFRDMPTGEFTTSISHLEPAQQVELFIARGKLQEKHNDARIEVQVQKRVQVRMHVLQTQVKTQLEARVNVLRIQSRAQAQAQVPMRLPAHVNEWMQTQIRAAHLQTHDACVREALLRFQAPIVLLGMKGPKGPKGPK
jgi:5-formaminoimidazole-4-carboxamide-1-beta-D-ribofuranosyl 5'-monophosphate synthetase